MGDRFYITQGMTITSERLKEKGIILNKNGTVKKKQKKDWILSINKELDANIIGLDKCTIDTLTQLHQAVVESHNKLCDQINDLENEKPNRN